MRAFLLGLQEDVHRRGRRRSLAERIGRPADWADRRRLRAEGAEAIYAAARRAAAAHPGSDDARRALRTALYAAWRSGRSEALHRRQGP
jgi:hypothetical protein